MKHPALILIAALFLSACGMPETCAKAIDQKGEILYGIIMGRGEGLPRYVQNMFRNHASLEKRCKAEIGDWRYSRIEQEVAIDSMEMDFWFDMREDVMSQQSEPAHP